MFQTYQAAQHLSKKTPVDTTAGEDATVVVTYPDGSTFEVPASYSSRPTHVRDKNANSRDQTVKHRRNTRRCSVQSATFQIAQMAHHLEYKTPADANTSGEKDATVVWYLGSSG